MNDYEMQSLAVLNRIAGALETIAMSNAPAPNFVKPIGAYAGFDYTSIGALVKASDANGPTELEWGGYLWTRRSPQNKFGEVIWFSRCIGKDADGTNKYARLITFKQMSEAEPLPRKVEAIVEKKNGQKPQPTSEPERNELEDYLGPNPRKAEYEAQKPAEKEQDDPTFCKLHHVKMSEVSQKSGLPYHRLTTPDGLIGFCNGVTFIVAKHQAQA